MTNPEPASPAPLAQPPAPTVWPLVTVNILAYNRREEVRITLQLLEGLAYPREAIEVLVVDNESSDGTREMVEREFPDVKVLSIAQNCGVAGWNTGFEAGRGDYFLVLDDDSAPESGLKEAITFLEANPQVGILACQIKGGAFTTQSLRDGQQLSGFIGCGALIRRSVVEKIGGFAPWIYLYAHEWEYGIRALDAGFSIRYFAQCVVRHRASSVNRSLERMMQYTIRNEMLIVYTHFSQRRALYLWRALLFNFWQWKVSRGQGWRPFLQGVMMFVRAARDQPQSPVRPQTQRLYARNFWSTQPIGPRAAKILVRKLSRKLGFPLLPDAPDVAPLGK